MEDIKFTSLQELYNRVRPALITRTNEIKRLGIKYVKEEDVWNYLKENKWNSSSNLTLIDMVNDILSADEYSVDEYIKRNMAKEARKINLDETDLL